jgi:hypothetical protein
MRFRVAAAEALQAKGRRHHAHARHPQAYVDAVERRSGLAGVQLLARGSAEGAGCAAQAALYQVDAATFLATRRWKKRSSARPRCWCAAATKPSCWRWPSMSKAS